jgi:hypothetical protein
MFIPSIFPSHHENVWGVEEKIHKFLTSILDGGEWSASYPVRFTYGRINQL